MPSMKGIIRVASDKSISHRALIISSVSYGLSRIKNLLRSDDCMSTMNCLINLGLEIYEKNDEMFVNGKGLRLKKPSLALDAGNSGTTVRLLSGILAGQDFTTEIRGDESLSKRPMNRIASPLERMGAAVSTTDGCLPLKIVGNKLKPVNYLSRIPSAQVKSCVLLAGLYPRGITNYTEPEKSRDHTERMLKNFGAHLSEDVNTISIKGEASLHSSDVFVPGDISSAAFFIVAALLCKNSELKIENVGINPTRMGILHVLGRMCGNIVIENKRTVCEEPIADIIVKSSDLKATVVTPKEISLLIDEIPIIAVAATQAHGVTRITGAGELRVKETDRLKAISTELKKMGANIEELEDGLVITGPTEMSGAMVNSYKDHRIAMSLAVASLVAGGNTEISDSECVKISFPDFWELLKKTTQ